MLGTVFREGDAKMNKHATMIPVFKKLLDLNQDRQIIIQTKLQYVNCCNRGRKKCCQSPEEGMMPQETGKVSH